jgi:hypothetical protein
MRCVVLMRTRCSVWARPSKYAKPSTVSPRDTAAYRRAPWSFCAATYVVRCSTRATDVLRAPCLSRGPCLLDRLASTITGTTPVTYLRDSLWVHCRLSVCTESFIRHCSQNKPVFPNRFGRWERRSQGWMMCTILRLSQPRKHFPIMKKAPPTVLARRGRP